ncbi:Y-family DNA polymerase [Jeotgalibaca caeni]|uniref:Y-family DNA polymerase n=1 Tax=Jeotgalibaca caeni TaxID=3028623 RepID=UPI00237EE807|nr:Y-family DNA polymerase [Jeotgalibaca caeni]MDE1548416.1 Y-family DNA polymerase [Jeotgalibaca caeni]
MIYMDYSNEPSRDILCIDIQSFFASVEAVHRNLHPRDTSIAVISRKEQGGGLILAASPFVKKQYGLKTGSRGDEIPPQSHIYTVAPRMAQYLEINQQINHLYLQFVAEEDLHIYSIDESFLDVTRSHAIHGTTREIAKKIQYAIHEKFGLIATIGIGDNPLLAKLALDEEAKSNHPSYLAEWRYKDVSDKVWGMKQLTDMWGIGVRTERRLLKAGVSSIHDLAQADIHALKKMYGVIGEQLFFHAHGIDRSILSKRFLPASKAFSKSQVLPRVYVNQYELEVVIREMADQVAARLRAHEVETNVIHLRVGFSPDIADPGFAHQVNVHPTSSSKVIIEECLHIFRRHYRGQPVRNVAISCGKVAPKSLLQFNLFEPPESTLLQEELERTVDRIRRKYGYPALVHASSLTSGATAIKRATLVGGHQG